MVPHKIRRGTDGKLRALCGPTIKDENKYIHPRGVKCVQASGVHYNIVQPMKSNELEPEEVRPTFRTPPGWVRIGAILIAVEQGVHGPCNLKSTCTRTGLSRIFY